MKKIFAIVVAGCMCLALAGCGSSVEEILSAAEEAASNAGIDAEDLEEILEKYDDTDENNETWYEDSEDVTDSTTADDSVVYSEESEYYISYDNGSMYSAGSGEISTAVDEIEINWMCGDINVEYYDGKTIRFTEESLGNLSESQEMHYIVDGTELCIQYAESDVTLWSGADKSLTLEIPKDVILNSFEINDMESEISIKDLSAYECSIETMAGNTKADNCAAKEFNFESYSGNLDFTGIITEEASIETLTGSATLNLDSRTEFTASIDALGGTFETDFDVTQIPDEDVFVCGDGTVSIEFESLSGSLTINKA